MNNKIQNKISKLISEAIEKDDYSKLEKYCLSDEYQSLSYVEKNYQFITSSKLKAFIQCQLEYKWKYVDLIPPQHDMGSQDHFTIGSAFDDLMTYGENVYQNKYIEVGVRVDIKEKLKEQEEKMESAKGKLNKDGSLSKVGENMIARAKEKIKYYKSIADKQQLTPDMTKKISQMKWEFLNQKMFNHQPKKKVLFMKMRGKHLLKVELDDFDGEIIRDLKTSRDVLSFDPEMYLLQATLYQTVVEIAENKLCPVELEVVDKYSYFSRSILVKYLNETLRAHRDFMFKKLEDLIEAHESGIFIQTPEDEHKKRSPYYGYEGYGRSTEPIYY